MKNDTQTQSIPGLTDFAAEMIKSIVPTNPSAANDDALKSETANQPIVELEREQIPIEAQERIKAMVAKPAPKAAATPKVTITPKPSASDNEPNSEKVPFNFNARARAWLDTASELPDAKLFRVFSFNELMAKKYVDSWLIEGLVELESVGMIFGNSASGKSLIVQEMCVCIAAGIHFHGRPTRQMRVLYIAGEGARGLQKRNAAICEKHNIENYNELDKNLFISEAPAAFLGDGDKGWVAIANTIEAMRHDGGGEVGLIVIDTLHRNFGNGDENSAKDFAEFMKCIDYIKLQSGAAIMLIHHSGNEAKDRARGSSSMKASMDWEFSVSKKDDVVTMTNTKMKDFDPPKPMSFEVVKLLESVVLHSTDFIDKKSSKRLTQNSSKTLESLYETIAEKGTLPPDTIFKNFKDSPCNIPKKVVTIEQWRIFAYAAITVDSDGDIAAEKKAKKAAFSRSRKELDDRGLVGIHGGFAWIPQSEISIDFSKFKVK